MCSGSKRDLSMLNIQYVFYFLNDLKVVISVVRRETSRKRKMWSKAGRLKTGGWGKFQSSLWLHVGCLFLEDAGRKEAGVQTEVRSWEGHVFPSAVWTSCCVSNEEHLDHCKWKAGCGGGEIGSFVEQVNWHPDILLISCVNLNKKCSHLQSPYLKNWSKNSDEN